MHREGRRAIRRFPRSVKRTTEEDACGANTANTVDKSAFDFFFNTGAAIFMELLNDFCGYARERKE